MSQFDDIYAENYRTLVRLATKMVDDGDIADDVVQEVFIYLFGKLSKGIQIQYPKSWLYRATMNKCIDQLKNQKRFQPIESISEKTVEEEEIEKHEMKATLNSVLSKLKPKERMLAILYSEGLSYKDLAEATGIKFSSIGKMLSRTLRKMEVELKKANYELY